MIIFAEPIMNIQNPYSEVEHKVFKRTFLQETEVGVEFDKPMTTEDFSTRIVPFVSKTFNVPIADKLDTSTEKAELTSSDGQVKFEFGLSFAKASIGRLAYKSFSSSVIQHITILVNFIKDVACVDEIKQTYINKINVWPIESKNSKSSFGAASFFIFKKEHIEDFANMKFEESDYPVGAAKEAVVKCGDSASLKATLRVELKDEQNASFYLALRAHASDVKVDNVISVLPKLNEIMFGAFTDIVSDNIFDLMSKESS